MKKRKMIGIIIVQPEAIYQQRIFDGVFAQCEKYDYDVAVFGPLVSSSHYYKEYLNGETNILNLINFDRLDGVIVASITLSSAGEEGVKEMVEDIIRDKCDKPVVTLDLPFCGFHEVVTDDRTAFSLITSHMLDEHNCQKIYFLTGQRQYEVSENRLRGYTDELEKRGVKVDENNIFYGDFWYSGGETLAMKIINGEVEKPDAVICASDHMAIGLVNKLIEYGIRVPEDVRVTGYDATAEASINSPAITSYIPDIHYSAAEAVNYLRRKIDPDAKIIPAERSAENGLRKCASCGCEEDIGYVKNRLKSTLYNSNHNYNEPNALDHVDICKLLDGYVFENFTRAGNVCDCMYKIFGADYLIRPYSHFWLCLTENWLDTDVRLKEGYTETMNNIIHTVPTDGYVTDDGIQYVSMDDSHVFDTSLMLPALDDDYEKPGVFYFSAVHFGDLTLGYAVLRCELCQPRKIDSVYRNWLRYVNSALEMIRVRERITVYSERDSLTGLYNRRGMTNRIDELMTSVRPTDSWMVFVIDMDGLKHINDTFGHNEGDYGISVIANAARYVTKKNEICVRSGGDEFYIIGVGDYSLADAAVKTEKFYQFINEENSTSDKPYEISASIGSCCISVREGITVEEAIQIADGRMYKNKAARKKERKQ